jgi:hypothetical protein
MDTKDLTERVFALMSFVSLVVMQRWIAER